MKHSLIFCPVNFQVFGAFVLEKSKCGVVLREAFSVLLGISDGEGKGCAELVGS